MTKIKRKSIIELHVKAINSVTPKWMYYQTTEHDLLERVGKEGGPIVSSWGCKVTMEISNWETNFQHVIPKLLKQYQKIET